MDAGSIFLICFAVIFCSLLIGGWRFGYSLLVCCEKRRALQDRVSQDRQRESGRVQGGQESAKASQEAQGHDATSQKDLVHSLSAPSTADKQPNPSPPTPPIRRLSSTASQPISSDGSYTCAPSDLIPDPHDNQNMTTVPPVPRKCPRRESAGIGTQVSLLQPIFWHENVLRGSQQYIVLLKMLTQPGTSSSTFRKAQSRYYGF
jgi:hypothetical protein